MRFPARRASFPTTHEMADYLETYAGTSTFRCARGRAVETMSKEGERYVLTAGERTFEAENVVVATGVMQKPYVPSFAPELDPRIRQLHSSDYRNLSQLQKGSVLVVGASHSGSTSPTRQRRSTTPSCRGRTRVRSRHRSRRGEDVSASASCSSLGSHVLTVDTPLGRKMRPHIRHGGAPLLRYRRKDLLAAGVERIVARTAGVQDGLPVLDDGRIVDVQNVIWCTGFRRDFSWIQVPFEVDEDGYPVQYRGVVGSAPGLYFVGLLFLHSFTSMLIGGTGRDAERVAKHIATRPTRVEAPATPDASIADQARLMSERPLPIHTANSRDRAEAPILVWNGLVTRMLWIGVKRRNSAAFVAADSRLQQGREATARRSRKDV